MIRRNKFNGGHAEDLRPSGKLNLMEQLIPPALAVCVYCNSLAGDFVHDDLSAITGNPDVIGADPADASGGNGSTFSSWDFLRNDFWGTSLLDPRSHKSYRPLTILTFKSFPFSDFFFN